MMNPNTGFGKLFSKYAGMLVTVNDPAEELVKTTLESVREADISSKYFEELLEYFLESKRDEQSITCSYLLIELATFRYYIKLELLSEDSDKDGLYKFLYWMEKFEDDLLNLVRKDSYK